MAWGFAVTFPDWSACHHRERGRPAREHAGHKALRRLSPEAAPCAKLARAAPLSAVEGSYRDIETYHVALTPISAKTFLSNDFSLRSQERRFPMRWIALDTAAASAPAWEASSGIDSPQFIRAT